MCLVWMLLFCGGTAWAENPPKTEAQVRLELLNQLKTDGYLSDKMALEATGKYVDIKALAAPVASSASGAKAQAPGLWERYLSWANVFKVIAVGLILVAAWGTISNIIRSVWHLLVQVPAWVYQAPLLTASVFATLRPELLWASQALYVCLLASVLNLMLLAWVAYSYPKIALKVASLFRLGLPIPCVLNFTLMLYFGVLALQHNSSLFGFAAAVCFSGVLTFGLAYRPGVLTLDFSDRALPAVIFGHLTALAAYAACLWTNVLPEQAKLFTAGGQVYWTIALGVGFLVACSPWVRNSYKTGYVALFALTLVGASLAYHMLDLQAVGAILYVFAILLALEWIGYLGFRGGLIFGCAAMGASLYGTSMLLERFGTNLIAAVL